MVDSDLVEPSVNSRLAAESREGIVGADECLLSDVGRFVVVAENAIYDIEDRLFVPRHDLIKAFELFFAGRRRITHGPFPALPVRAFQDVSSGAPSSRATHPASLAWSPSDAQKL